MTLLAKNSWWFPPCYLIWNKFRFLKWFLHVAIIANRRNWCWNFENLFLNYPAPKLKVLCPTNNALSWFESSWLWNMYFFNSGHWGHLYNTIENWINLAMSLSILSICLYVDNSNFFNMDILRSGMTLTTLRYTVIILKNVIFVFIWVVGQLYNGQW